MPSQEPPGTLARLNAQDVHVDRHGEEKRHRCSRPQFTAVAPSAKKDTRCAPAQPEELDPNPRAVRPFAKKLVLLLAMTTLERHQATLMARTLSSTMTKIMLAHLSPRSRDCRLGSNACSSAPLQLSLPSLTFLNRPDCAFTGSDLELNPSHHGTYNDCATRTCSGVLFTMTHWESDTRQ